MAGHRRLAYGGFAALLAAGCGLDDGTADELIQVAVTPVSLTVFQGGSGSLQAALTRGGNFTGTVTLASSGLPAGVSVGITPSQLSGATATATIAVSVAAIVTPGQYTLTITASAPGVDQARTDYQLTVTGAPDIALSVSPFTRRIVVGGTGSATVNISRTNFTGPVTLAVLDAPAGISATFDPSPTSSGETTLTINVASSVDPGHYTLTIRGTGAGLAPRSTILTVTVLPLVYIPVYRFCGEEQVPAFVAYQDGVGPWQALTGAVSGSETRFSFGVFEGYGGVMFVYPSAAAVRSHRTSTVRALPARKLSRSSQATLLTLASGSYYTEVRYGSTVELAEDSAESCHDEPASKTLTATVAGVPAGRYGILSLSEETHIFNGATPTNPVTFSEAPGGPLDFVATRTAPGNPPDKAIVLRNLNLADGESFPVDFNGPTAVTPFSAPVTISGGGADGLEVFVDLVTANNPIGSGMWFDLSPSPVATRTWAGLRNSDLLSGEYHALTVFATPPGGGAGGTGEFRVATRYVAAVAPQSIAMGPSFAATVATQVAGGTVAYPRYRFQGTLPPEYDKGVEIDLFTAAEGNNSLTMLASAGYLAIRGNPLGYDLSMPDVAGLAGFPIESRLSVGTNKVATTASGFTGAGIFELVPAPGAESKSAVKVSAITVP